MAMEQAAVKVMIVEDQRVERQMLEAYVAASPRYRLVRSIENASFAEMYCTRGEIDLIIMDVCTANDESGLYAAARIKRYWPQIKIIIVTSMPDCTFLDKARAAGAESFWYKDVSQEELIEVMDRTVAGERLYPGHTPELQIGEASSESFTPRELEILQGLVEYGSDREIADHLNISIDTVRFHIKNLLSKTGYPSRTKLAIAVVSRKLILPDY
jgi:two-component system vancomycin resistance associated response regulator VraR